MRVFTGETACLERSDPETIPASSVDVGAAATDPRVLVARLAADRLVLRAACVSVVERLLPSRELLIVPLAPVRFTVRVESESESESESVRSRLLRPHSLCHLAHGSPVTVEADREAAVLIVALPPGRLASLRSDAGGGAAARCLAPVLGLDHPDLPLLSTAIVRLLRTRPTPDEVFLRCALDWFASRCAVEIAHVGAGIDVAGRALEEGALRATLDRIERAIPDPVPINALADALGMTSSRFSRAFKRSMGVPPSRYVLARRVARACELLERGGMSLVEITFACGFASQSHMTSVFLRERSVTPGRYRDALHERGGSRAGQALEPDSSSPGDADRGASRHVRTDAPRRLSLRRSITGALPGEGGRAPR